MSETENANTNQSPTPDKHAKAPAPRQVDVISPDELMSDFRGQSLARIVLFTVVLHFVVLTLFSPGYIKKQIFGESPEPDQQLAELSDEEKLSQAEKDGKDALREIADRYGITVNELKTQLARGSAPSATTDPQRDPTADPLATDAAPDSQIEKDLQLQTPGPAVPDLSVDDEEDLFAPDAP